VRYGYEVLYRGPAGNIGESRILIKSGRDDHAGPDMERIRLRIVERMTDVVCREFGGSVISITRLNEGSLLWSELADQKVAPARQQLAEMTTHPLFEELETVRGGL
jgi:hypothetical protein